MNTLEECIKSKKIFPKSGEDFLIQLINELKDCQETIATEDVVSPTFLKRNFENALAPGKMTLNGKPLSNTYVTASTVLTILKDEYTRKHHQYSERLQNAANEVGVTLEEAHSAFDNFDLTPRIHSDRLCSLDVLIRDLSDVRGDLWKEILNKGAIRAIPVLLKHLIFALNHVALQLEKEKLSEVLEKSIYEEDIAHILILMSQVNTLAEELTQKASLLHNNLERDSTISSQRSIAARAKHAPTDEIKSRYIVWYSANKDEGIFHSFTQAAAKFHSSLSSDDQRRLQPEALVIHLRKYLKSQI